MKKGDYVFTPRFLKVKIEKVFMSKENAYKAGYTEPTHANDIPGFGVLGKSLDMYHMKFAGYRK